MPNTWQTPAANPQYKTQRANNASEQVLGLYQTNFGRSASPAEIKGWVDHVGGGDYLAPDKLNVINTEFQKAPEYSQYQGYRPTVNPGEFIPGVTLGTTLASDQALFQQLPQQAVPAEQETTNAHFQSQIRDTLLKLLNDGQQVPTAQDPMLSPAISAYNAGQNKASARLINQNAEAFGAAGLESSGARDAADRNVIEQQGLNEGTFASNAVLNELQARRSQVMAALQAAAAINDQDTSRRLQEQLAQLNAAVQREGLANQMKLGESDIKLREKLGMGNLNLGLAGLAQQGRQFNDSLGFNVAQLEADLNNKALVNLLFGS